MCAPAKCVSPCGRVGAFDISKNLTAAIQRREADAEQEEKEALAEGVAHSSASADLGPGPLQMRTSESFR